MSLHGHYGRGILTAPPRHPGADCACSTSSFLLGYSPHRLPQSPSHKSQRNRCPSPFASYGKIGQPFRKLSKERRRPVAASGTFSTPDPYSTCPDRAKATLRSSMLFPLEKEFLQLATSQPSKSLRRIEFPACGQPDPPQMLARFPQ
jgi:hypothetical protein